MDAVFTVLAATSLGSAVMVVTRRNPVSAALYLVLAFFCLAGIYVLINLLIDMTYTFLDPRIRY